MVNENSMIFLLIVYSCMKLPEVVSATVQQRALIEEILEGNFTGDDVDTAVSIIRRASSMGQSGAGFGLEREIEAVTGLHNMLRRKPENSAEFLKESNGRVSNCYITNG